MRSRLNIFLSFQMVDLASTINKFCNVYVYETTAMFVDSVLQLHPHLKEREIFSLISMKQVAAVHICVNASYGNLMVLNEVSNQLNTLKHTAT